MQTDVAQDVLVNWTGSHAQHLCAPWRFKTIELSVSRPTMRVLEFSVKIRAALTQTWNLWPKIVEMIQVTDGCVASTDEWHACHQGWTQAPSAGISDEPIVCLHEHIVQPASCS